MYKTRIKEKWWFSQCGRTWLVCRKQLNTSGVTLNEDLEPKTHHQTPMTYGYRHFIHFKTVATEVEIQFLSTWIMFPSLPQFWKCLFSSREKGCQYFCPHNECTSHWCLVMSLWNVMRSHPQYPHSPPQISTVRCIKSHVSHGATFALYLTTFRPY